MSFLKRIENKLDFIISLLRKDNMTIAEILQKEDATEADVQTLVTDFQSAQTQLTTVQAELATLQAGTVTDAQLQSVSDKIDAIKTTVDGALPPAPTA